MPKKPKELERIILEDGWVFKMQTGSHRHYTHPTEARQGHHSVSLQGHSERHGKFHFEAGRFEIISPASA